jgi:hypothetical protein
MAARERVRFTIDTAKNGSDVAHALDAIRSEWPDLDDTLVEMLFERSCDPGWRKTEGFRVLFSKRMFAPARKYVRHHVVPRYHALQERIARHASWALGATTQPKELAHNGAVCSAPPALVDR